MKIAHCLIIYKSKNKYPGHTSGNTAAFHSVFSLREANCNQKHEGLTSLLVQNFLQFVKTVQFFIFATFHAPEYSAVEKNIFLDC